jgi:hypothetical protein
MAYFKSIVFLSDIGQIPFEKMNAEEAKEFLKDRGIPTMNYPHGYLLKVSRREGSPSRRIEMDELDTILTLGKVKLIAVEDNVGDILIEVEKKDLIRD